MLLFLLIAELEGEVRQLQRELKAAHADDVEVQQLVAAHEKEKAANTRLRAELESTQVRGAGSKFRRLPAFCR